MTKTLHSILVVDENPSFPGLVAVTGNCKYDIKLEEANSPEMGMELLKSINPPAVIWSNQKFTNSDIDGKKFLNNCRETSPLSARVLCGTSLLKDDMDYMVGSSAIHSFYNSEIYELDSMLTSLKIGIEFHKICLFEHFLSSLKLKSISRSDRTLKEYSNIKKEIGWITGLTRDWIDFDNHHLELTQLSNYTQSVLSKIPATTSNLISLSNELATEKKNEYEKRIMILEKVQSRVDFIGSFLTHSKTCLNRSLNHVAQTALLTAETDEKIKRLKSKLADE
jgi:hypothetical protein